MKRMKVFYILLSQILFIEFGCAQHLLKLREVDFKEQKDFWANNRSLNREGQFSFMTRGKRFSCTMSEGLIYIFDLKNERVINNKSEFINDGYTNPYEYYIDGNVIAWEKRKNPRIKLDSTYTLKIYNYLTNKGQEKSFFIPRKYLSNDAITIIDTNRVLINNLIFHANKTIPDTLKVNKNHKMPYFDDHTFMRRNMYITDACFDAKERCDPKFYGLSFTKIMGNEIKTFNLGPENVAIPINTYRIEADFNNFLLMSNKIEPSKFMLYDMLTHKAYPFNLDSSIFNLKNLARRKIESKSNPSLPDEYPPSEVDFNFSCSMDESNLYITVHLIQSNQIKTYRVDNYMSISK